MKPTLQSAISTLIIFFVLLSLGCSTTKETTERAAIPSAADTASVSDEETTPLQTMLAQNRSKLSDVYNTQKQDMPEVFTQKDSSKKSINSDPSDGYRVQIISTRNKRRADSVAYKFRMWSDSTIAGYTAQAYVFFRQPFYKVHIGDFTQRDKANSFSKLIKNRYPEAWVVHDRINPTNIPADRASFSIIPPSESKDKSISNADSLKN
jgi:hypothetical protein